jgi:hypothetical protein
MTVAVANTRRKLSLRDWQRWEQVGLKPHHELDELVLNWTDHRVKDLDALGALVSLSIERTIEGGSTITMTLRDPDRQLFRQRAGRTRPIKQRGRKAAYKRDPVLVDEGWEPMLAPDLIGRAAEVELDGVVFRLVKIRHTESSGETELTFEDRLVYWLKRKKGAKRANRKRVTRAEFVLSLLREVKSGRYRLVCPELHKRQPIDSHGKSARSLAKATLRSTSSSSSSSSTDERSGGFARNARITVKGTRATPDQRRNLHGVLTECQAQGCSHDVMVATVCCVTQESVAKRLGYGDAAGPDSRGLFQQRAPWGSSSARLDPRKSTRMFLTGGGGGQPGWKQKHGSLKRVPGSIESAVKAVQVSVGGYGQHEREARHTVKAWGGAGADGSSGSGGGTYTKSYQFTRNTGESSWDAIKRLADEVGWRCFVVGNSVYYMSESDLYARRARYEVAPDDASVLELTYDVDWGRPVSELTLTVALDEWGAPPGSVVLVDGYGPPDGRWLIVSTRRDYFEPTAEVQCRQPGKEKLEPANERGQRAANASSSSSGSSGEQRDASKGSKLYREAKRISDAGGTYVYGGGHGPRLSSLSSGQGLDCSSSVSLALYRAGMMEGRDNAIVSGAFASSWGKPGRGETFTVWANAGHVWIQLHGLGNAWRFDTSPYGSGGRGPRLRSTPRPTAGFTPRHFPGA